MTDIIYAVSVPQDSREKLCNTWQVLQSNASAFHVCRFRTTDTAVLLFPECPQPAVGKGRYLHGYLLFADKNTYKNPFSDLVNM